MSFLISFDTLHSAAAQAIQRGGSQSASPEAAKHDATAGGDEGRELLRKINQMYQLVGKTFSYFLVTCSYLFVLSVLSDVFGVDAVALCLVILFGRFLLLCGAVRCVPQAPSASSPGPVRSGGGTVPKCRSLFLLDPFGGGWIMMLGHVFCMFLFL